MIQPSTLLTSFKEGIFNELNAFKRKKEQMGYDMIDLSIGSPDQSPSIEIRQVLANEVLKENAYGYSLHGTDAFHEAVANFYQSEYGVKLDPENEVLQTMGSQDGLVHFPLTICNPGDIVLVPDPGYTAYEAGITLAQAKAYPMPLLEENDFLPDFSKIPTEILKKAKMMILNYPGNPVPKLATRAFFEEVVQIAKIYDIFIVHDFAYSELVFDEEPLSFLSIPGASEVGIEFNSLSKSFNLAGARVAYVVGNAEALHLLQKLKSNLDYGVFYPIQSAATKALTAYQTFAKKNKKVYKKRRDDFVTGLQEIGWDVRLPQGTMFVWAKIPSSYTSYSFTYELMDKANVVVTPGNAFGKYGEGYVRMALVQPVERLQKAVLQIKQSQMISTK